MKKIDGRITRGEMSVSVHRVDSAVIGVIGIVDAELFEGGAELQAVISNDPGKDILREQVCVQARLRALDS